MYDYDDFDPHFRNDSPLGYVNQYSLNSLPAGFSPGVEYVWGAAVGSPVGGLGLSFWVHVVTFSSGLAAGEATLTRVPASQVWDANALARLGGPGCAWQQPERRRP